MQFNDDCQSVNASDPVSWRNIPTDWKKRSLTDIEALARAIRYSAAKDPPPKAESVYRKIERMEAHCKALRKQEAGIADASSTAKIAIDATKPTAANTAVLQEHAIAIRDLGKRTVEQVIEIGQRLTECKRLARGHFGDWLKIAFGWTQRTAERFMSLHEWAKSRSDNLSDLDLPLSALYLLVAPSTSEEVRDEVIARAEAGETISLATVKKAITESKAVEPMGIAEVPADDPEMADIIAARARHTVVNGELVTDGHGGDDDCHQDGGRDHKKIAKFEIVNHTTTTAPLSRKARRAIMRVKIKHLAVRLAERDADIARELYGILWEDDRNAQPLVEALALALGIDEESDDGTAAEMPVVS